MLHRLLRCYRGALRLRGGELRLRLQQHRRRRWLQYLLLSLMSQSLRRQLQRAGDKDNG